MKETSRVAHGENSIASIGSTRLDDSITEFGLALLAGSGVDWQPVGTAIVVAPHLAVTAKHVVDHCWRTFGQEHKLKFGDLHGDFGLIAFQMLPTGKGCLWAVRKCWRSPHSDLAVLQLDAYSEPAKTYRWRRPKLRVCPPAVGAKISSFGYLGGTVSATEDDTTLAISYDCAPKTAVGTVLEIHHERRDLGMLTFPCFRTNAPFGHGMSGGPIFVDGELNGIVCQSGIQENGQMRAYGMTLWPILATTLEVSLEHKPIAPITVYDLARRGYLNVSDLGGIEMAYSPDGTQTITYRYDNEMK
jgi:hypothetical protein